MIRALKYLAEKYPGIVALVPGDAHTLTTYIRCWSNGSLVFLSRIRQALPEGLDSRDHLAGNGIRFEVTNDDPEMFAATNDYLNALHERYPDSPIDLEDHLPVLEQLIGRRQEWQVLASHLRKEIEEAPRTLRPYKKDLHIKFGWGNGYVGVCEGHPWFKRFYDAIDAEVHGGLTYADDARPRNESSSPDGLWWVGFDTGHWTDDLIKWPKEKVEREARYLYLQAAWAFAGIDNPMQRR